MYPNDIEQIRWSSLRRQNNRSLPFDYFLLSGSFAKSTLNFYLVCSLNGDKINMTTKSKLMFCVKETLNIYQKSMVFDTDDKTISMPL